MKIHIVKCWPKYFKPLQDGRKTFDIRVDDRGYQVGDVLNSREFDVLLGYTGKTCLHFITYITRDADTSLPDFTVAPNMVVLGLRPCLVLTNPVLENADV